MDILSVANHSSDPVHGGSAYTLRTCRFSHLPYLEPLRNASAFQRTTHRVEKWCSAPVSSSVSPTQTYSNLSRSDVLWRKMHLNLWLWLVIIYTHRMAPKYQEHSMTSEESSGRKSMIFSGNGLTTTFKSCRSSIWGLYHQEQLGGAKGSMA